MLSLAITNKCIRPEFNVHLIEIFSASYAFNIELVVAHVQYVEKGNETLIINVCCGKTIAIETVNIL